MDSYGPAVAVLVLTVGVVALVYAVSLLVTVHRQPLSADEFLSGSAPVVHAVSRYHVRWYTVTLIFLAFDMEMVFMYPWAVVFADVGLVALVEMFCPASDFVAGRLSQS
ncbi:MAG: NADH-quinone oxidoreductase subunit A [Streptosporangiales bacterium]|nr:NADH-quinone oxidoreductase subunit A [Streptosporangiales bacterium]